MALGFSNEGKIRQQMKARGWTEALIEEALQAPGIRTNGKNGPATRHVHPVTGKSVVVDNATGKFSTSEARDFYMTETIYIPLEDEGVPVRRPAPAYRRDDGSYIVLRPAGYDASIESWRFPPGSTVECERVHTPDGEILNAVKGLPDAPAKPAKKAI